METFLKSGEKGLKSTPRKSGELVVELDAQKSWKLCSNWKGHLLRVQREMETEGKVVSVSQLCRWFGVFASSLYYRPRPRRQVMLDSTVVTAVRRVIEKHMIGDDGGVRTPSATQQVQ